MFTQEHVTLEDAKNFIEYLSKKDFSLEQKEIVEAGKKYYAQAKEKGSRNNGFYENYKQIKSTSVNNGVKSIQKVIKQHIDNLKNPYMNYPQFDARPYEQKQRDKVTWLGQLQRQVQQYFILKGILDER